MGYLRHRCSRRRTRSLPSPSQAVRQEEGSFGGTNRELIADRETRIAARLRTVQHEYHAAIERNAVPMPPEPTGGRPVRTVLSRAESAIRDVAAVKGGYSWLSTAVTGSGGREGGLELEHPQRGRDLPYVVRSGRSGAVRAEAASPVASARTRAHLRNVNGPGGIFTGCLRPQIYDRGR